MTRSLQFTALGTLEFADVPVRQMADANSLFNVVAQLSMAAGTPFITPRAISLRLGEAFCATLDDRTATGTYAVAFVVTAVRPLVGLLDAVRLPLGAGDRFVAR